MSIEVSPLEVRGGGTEAASFAPLLDQYEDDERGTKLLQQFEDTAMATGPKILRRLPELPDALCTTGICICFELSSARRGPGPLFVRGRFARLEHS